LQNIVCFIGLFCKRDLYLYSMGLDHHLRGNRTISKKKLYTWYHSQKKILWKRSHTSLQHTAMHCNTLERIATQYMYCFCQVTDFFFPFIETSIWVAILMRDTERGSIRKKYSDTWPKKKCSVLQCVAVCCSVLDCLQCVAVWCSVLQCVAVCCSVLQCVAVCCSVLQCVFLNVTLCDTKLPSAECCDVL